MKRLLPALLGLLACTPASQQTYSKADPRLGVVVFETNDRLFSRAPPEDLAGRRLGHVRQNRGRVTVAADGTVYVLLGLDAARPFGTANDVVPARVLVKKLASDDRVSDLPPPELGSGGTPRGTSFVLAGDGEHPVIVDAHGEWNPAGRFVAITAFDGAAWRTVSFLRSDRPAADRKGTWEPAEDQVRVLRPGLVVVQHGDTLVRVEGAGWAPVALPPKVKELRLGAATADAVRAYWTTTDGAVETDVLLADGSWRGSTARFRRGPAPLLRGLWGFAGDLETFTAHFGAGGEVQVARHEGGAWKLATSRPPEDGEVAGDAYLIGTRHPFRSVFVSRAGALTASYAGKPTGPLGTVIGYVAGPQVTCTGDVTVGEGMVLAKDGAACIPRTLDALDFRLAPDAMTMVELFADLRQDATLRWYVKRIPLPSTNTDVTVSQPAQGGFPGDTGAAVDGGTPPTDQRLIEGVVLTPGLDDHSGTTCMLFGRPQGAPVETVQTELDGTVSFSPVAPGSAYDVQCNRTGFQTLHAAFEPGPPGVARLDGILVLGQVPDDIVLPGSVEYELDGGTLVRRDFMTTRTLSNSVAPGDSVRLLGDDAVWQEADGSFRSSVNSAVFSPPRALSSFRRVANQLVAAQGVPDGVTALAWTTDTGSTPLLSEPAVEVASYGYGGGCNGVVVWLPVGAEVRAQLASCNVPTSLYAGTQSVGPLPPTKALNIGAAAAWGWLGDGCGAEGGYTRECPVFLYQVLQPGALSGSSLSSAAVEVVTQEVNGRGSRLLWLERTGTTATLHATGWSASTSTLEVQAGLTLPSRWFAGESPITPVAADSLRVLVRTADGAYVTTGEAGSWTRVAQGVRAVFPNGVVVLDDGSMVQVLGDGSLRALPIKGDEHLRWSSGGLITQAETMPCPDGTQCPLLVRMTWAFLEVTPLASGRFVPDVVAQPMRFGAPSPRLLKAQLAWPSRRVTLPP